MTAGIHKYGDLNPEAPGGIDFNAAMMHMSIQKNGHGVEMHFDPATIARIKAYGFDGLEFNIQSIVHGHQFAITALVFCLPKKNT